MIDQEKFAVCVSRVLNPVFVLGIVIVLVSCWGVWIGCMDCAVCFDCAVFYCFRALGRGVVPAPSGRD